jgi:N-acetyl-gamma-glutamyl-phosphate reductase
MPMNRGILSTIYVKMIKGATIDDLRQTLDSAYESEAFVHVLPKGQAPATHHVRGSNLCLIGLAQDRQSGRAILVSAIDNLVKGASGQAVQDMNVMLGVPETSGLQQEALFP